MVKKKLKNFNLFVLKKPRRWPNGRGEEAD
jgi:hypothetical protein